jgi:hypothetical protein
MHLVARRFDFGQCRRAGALQDCLSTKAQAVTTLDQARFRRFLPT